MTISTKYLGCELSYSEDGDAWSTHIDPNESSTYISAKSLKELKLRVAKAVGPSERTPVIISNWGGDHYATVNPLMDDSYVWITFEGGKRSKERLDNIRADTPENRALLLERATLRKQIKALEAKCNALGDQMTPYVPITKADAPDHGRDTTHSDQ